MIPNLLRLLRHARRYRARLIIAFLAAVGVSATTAMQPVVVRAAIDRGIIRHDIGALTRTIAVLAVIGLVNAALFSTRKRHIGRYSYSAQADLRQGFYEHVLSLDSSYHEHMSAGQLMSRGTADLQAAGEFLHMVAWLLTLVLQITFAIVAMFALDVPLALGASVLLPILVWAGARFSSRFNPIVWRIQQKLGDFAALAEQTVTGIRVVKAFGRESHLTERAAGEAEAVREASMDGVRISARYMPLFHLVPQLAVVTLLWLGGRRVLHHDITLGTLIAFNAYVTLLVWPLQELGQLFSTAQRAATSAGRIFEVLDTPPTVADAQGAKALPAGEGRVRVEGVRLSFEQGRSVLDGIDLDVPAGTSLAIVGPTGCGKSTLLELVARFTDPDEGRVTIDGTDIRDVTMASLRASLGMVSEDTYLFSDTIAANIAYGHPDAPRADIVRAARIAQADGFIRDLPRDYATRVGEHGYSLSGGQRQRIALARAILVDPRILLLDDATSSVDTRVEAAIRRGLADAMHGRTTILVARRPSSAALADRVAFLQAGRIVAFGTHEDLWRDNPAYREVLGGADVRAPVAAAVRAAYEDVPEPAPEAPTTFPEDDEPDTKPRHFGRRELRVLAPVLRPEIRPAAIALGLLLVSQIAGLSSPFLLRYAIDSGISKGRTGPLDRAAGVMLVIAVTMMLAKRVSILLAGRAGQNALRRLRERVFAHMTGLDLAFFERERTGVIVSRLTADLQAVEMLVVDTMVWAGSLVVYLAGSVVVLIVLDLPMGLASLVLIGPLLFALSAWFRSRSEETYTRIRRSTAAVLTALQESLRGFSVIQVFARQRRNAEDFSERNVVWREANLDSIKLAGTYFPGVDIVRLGATIMVLALGGWRVFRGDITVGLLAAFLLHLQATTEPIMALSQIYDQFQSAMAGLSRVAELLAEQPRVIDHHDATPLDDARGELALRTVGFRYAPEAPPALDGVDLHAHAGKVIALVGETGAGKSTIAKLLLRFYDPTAGVVGIDGRDLRDVTTASRQEHSAFVPQEGYLFDGTVRENIRFGRPAATDIEVEDVCDRIGVGEALRGLPSGYDTDVASLSGGERQMIALARALVADPRVLVLDEATSAIDPGTEAHIQRALEHAFQDRTTVLIAHRLSTVMRADVIAVVHHGRIVELGSHDELVARPEGVYASLFTHWLVSA